MLVMLAMVSVFMSGDFNSGVKTKNSPATNGNWIDVADTGWYYANPEGPNFVVNSAEELAGLVKLVNGNVRNFYGKTIYLAASIDLSDRKWTQISNNISNPFQGTLDGQGHTIANMTFDAESYCAGLFGRNGDRGTVKDVNLTNVYVSSSPSHKYSDNVVHVGSIAGWNDGTIEGCAASGYISAYSLGGSSSAGGIAGLNFGTIAGCAYNGDISARSLGGGSNTGGITVSNNGTVADCVFKGNVSSYSYFGLLTSYAGGIVGFHVGEMVGCVSSGDVSSFSYFFRPLGSNVGGIAGYSYRNIENCSSNGNIYSLSYFISSSHTGGIVGQTGTSSMIEDCTSSGNVSSYSYFVNESDVAGIVGWNSGTIEGCTFKGEKVISRFSRRGGLSGRDYNRATSTNNRNDSGVEPDVGLDKSKESYRPDR
jgi:hypothetical protein